jgi:hypothetical protein
VTGRSRIVRATIARAEIEKHKVHIPEISGGGLAKGCDGLEEGSLRL